MNNSSVSKPLKLYLCTMIREQKCIQCMEPESEIFTNRNNTVFLPEFSVFFAYRFSIFCEIFLLSHQIINKYTYFNPLRKQIFTIGNSHTKKNLRHEKKNLVSFERKKNLWTICFQCIHYPHQVVAGLVISQITNYL